MPKAKKSFGKFRVLRGIHSEGGKTYKAGDVVESASDLLKHNTPGSPKFASADDVVKTEESEKSDDEAFNEMSFDELKAYAAEGEVDVTGATTKAQLIERIKAAEA